MDYLNGFVPHDPDMALTENEVPSWDTETIGADPKVNETAAVNENTTATPAVPKKWLEHWEDAEYGHTEAENNRAMLM